MNPHQRLYGIRPGWLLVASLILFQGCVPPAGERPVGEPPLTPVTSPSADPSRIGQQEASLQLTDEGRRLLNSGQLNEAVSVFQKAVSLYPNNPYAYYYLAQARYQKRDYAQSLAQLRQSELFLSGDSVWLARVYALRGQVYEARSFLDDAREQYRKALEFDAANPDAREGLERVQTLSPRGN